jgi:hypothetical protein
VTNAEGACVSGVKKLSTSWPPPDMVKCLGPACVCCCGVEEKEGIDDWVDLKDDDMADGVD